MAEKRGKAQKWRGTGGGGNKGVGKGGGGNVAAVNRQSPRQSTVNVQGCGGVSRPGKRKMPLAAVAVKVEARGPEESR